MLTRVLHFFPDDVGGAVVDDIDTAAADANRAADALDGTGAAGSGGTPAKPRSIGETSKAFLASLSPEERDRPLNGPDDEELDAAEEGVRPGAITRDDGAVWNPDAGPGGRWQRTDGTFAEGAAPANAPAAAAKGAEPAAGGKPTTITLAGHDERGEQPIEIEIDDPAVAERIRRLQNDGLRAADYKAKSAALDSREAEIRGLEDGLSELAANPVGFTLRNMTADRQLELASALIIEHWDRLVPLINQYNTDPAARANARVDARDGAARAAEAAASERALRNYVRDCMTVVEGLVPEDTDRVTRGDFIADARATLAAAAREGRHVTKDTVAQLLERRVKQYGFDKKPAAPVVPTARPVSDRARALADSAAGATPAAGDASRRLPSAAQERRAAARRVAPAGAGAVATQQPLLKPEDKVDIKSASKALRRAGLPETW